MKSAYVIDDDSFYTDLISTILDENNYFTKICNHPSDINFEHLINYDFLLLDLSMPKMDGNLILQYLNKHKTNVSIIIISGNENIEFENKKMISDHDKLNIIGYLKKPFSKMNLKKLIEAASN